MKTARLHKLVSVQNMHSLKCFEEALGLGLVAGILEQRHEIDKQPYL